MEKGDERMREFTVAALGEIAPRTRLPDLIAWMRDPVAGVRYRATQAVAKLREPTSGDALLQALHDPDQRVRELAVSGLSELRDPRAVEPLMGLLKDSAVGVRAGAVEALNRFHDEQALPALVAAVCDPEEQVTRVAVTGVTSFGCQAVPYVTAARDMLDKQADPRGYQLLTQILNDCGAGAGEKRGGNFLGKAGAFWRRK
jgi:HEAT repeat protein